MDFRHLLLDLLTVDWSLLYKLFLFIPSVFLYLNSFFFNLKFWQKINLVIKERFIEFIKLFISVYCLIYFSMVLYNWWLYEKKSLELAYQYLITIVIFLAISSAFAILNYFVHVIQNDAFAYNTDLLKYSTRQGNTEEVAEKKIQNIENEIDKLKIINSQVSNNPKFKIFYGNEAKLLLGQLTIDNLNQYSIISSSYLEIAEITQSSFYYIQGRIFYPRRGDQYYHYFLDNQEIIYLENISVLKNLNFSDKEEIIKLIKHRLTYLEDVKLPYWKEYKTQSTLSIGFFIQASLLEIMGLKQNYIMPLSSTARILYLIFGLYKFLLFGAFILLILK